MEITREKLLAMDVDENDVKTILTIVEEGLSPNLAWEKLAKGVLRQYPFSLHQFLFMQLYPYWNNLPSPAWFPAPGFIKTTNLNAFMAKKNIQTYASLHQWSVENREEYWQDMLSLLNIQLIASYSALLDLSHGIEAPIWLKDATLNIAASCFQGEKEQIAIICQNENGKKQQITYDALNALSNQVANSLSGKVKKQSRVAIIMPMTIEAIAIYLGALKADCTIVSIPESFAEEEISKRFEIAKVDWVFTEYTMLRDGKTHPLYDKIVKANAPSTVILGEKNQAAIREQDLLWQDFLSENKNFKPTPCSSQDIINILFSSGTTGDPKAIPWLQTTPIKCAADAYFHHNVQKGDIFCWPSSLGWMMGPWLIFACLINKATMALFDGVPSGKAFGKFIQDAKVTHLGVVPTIVKSWRNSRCMEELDWSQIKLFASTGEVSNVMDMLYLMHLAQYKPIIEYCGGTEIGGAYITSTPIEPSSPSIFTTPTLGLDFVILDEQGKSADYGEVAIIGPSIGLSSSLLNQEHYQVYYADMPEIEGKTLRRHGDEIKRFPNGQYRLLGRADDTIKLSGIKISSAEIEAVLNGNPEVYETAAIGVASQEGGPSELIIYVVTKSIDCDLEKLKSAMQNAIKTHLNPLFKIQAVIKIDALPRTASNKILRRELKKGYINSSSFI